MWGNKVGFHNIVQFGFLIGFLVKANPKKWELYLICEKFKNIHWMEPEKISVQFVLFCLVYSLEFRELRY